MFILYIYIAGVVFMNLVSLIKNPDTGFRGIFIVIYFWPIMLPFLIAGVIGYDFNWVKTNRPFGIRKPADKKAIGIGITLFYWEFQFWKIKNK